MIKKDSEKAFLAKTIDHLLQDDLEGAQAYFDQVVASKMHTIVNNYDSNKNED